MFKENTIKLGIAPIAWTNDDMPDLGAENTFEQCISEMALAGFTGSEVGNKYPRDTERLTHALKLRNMEIASAWFSAYLTTTSYEETAEKFIQHRDFLFEMGAKVIVVSEQGHSIQGQDKRLFEEKPYFTEVEWERLALGLNELGKLAKEKDMKLVYHHHMGTGVQTTEEIEKLLDMTDENLVYLLYDTGHLYVSGEDPLYILNRYFSRIKHVHLKDVRDPVAALVKNEKLSFLSGVREGMFTVPGDGSIDFVAILQLLADFGYEGWMIVEAEQDPAQADPLEYALIAREYIRSVTGL